MLHDSINLEVEKSLERLLGWIQRNGTTGYDPYDALSQPWIEKLDRRSGLAGRVAIHSLKNFPFNLRPVLGIKKIEDAKALGLLARGYFLLWDDTQNELFWNEGIACLETLHQLIVPGFSGASWAHPFPYRSSRLYLPANSPNIVSTVYAAQAFLDAYQRKGQMRWLDIARSACKFIMNELERIGSHEKFCFSYLPNQRLAIHNANLLAVQFLARCAALGLDEEKSMIELITPALKYTLDDQNPDGSWFYDGPDSPLRSKTFVDGFHTGFVLESLWDISCDTGLDIEKPISSGLKFYIQNLFSDHEKPDRMVNKLWPVDLRDCAQAIIVFAKLGNLKKEITHKLAQVISWTNASMQSQAGFYYFSRNKSLVSLVPYIRFQAWMLCALATANHYFPGHVKDL